MKKIISNTLVAISFMFTIACNGHTNNTRTDSSKINNRQTAPASPQAPRAVDTMPVLRPGNPDRSSTIKTPRTHDNNVIVPDTSTRPK